MPVVALLLAGSPSHAADNRVNLHLEPTGARFLGAPQNQLFGWGGGAAARVDVRLVAALSVQVGVGMLEFLSQTAGVSNGRALWAGGGLRVRLFERDGPLSALWIDAQANVVGTGPRVRFGYELGAGADFSLARWLTFGPFVRFAQVVQPAVPEEDPSSALMLQFGLSLSFGMLGSGADSAPHPTKELPPPAAEPKRPPAPPPPEPPAPAPPQVTPPAPAPPPTPGPPEVITRDRLEITRAVDTENDGIPDSRDLCPEEPETFNGVDDDDGCPDLDKGEPLVVITKTKLEVKPPLRFDKAGRPDKASQAVLATVARVLLLHAELRKVRVETREPSKQRAAAIRLFLEARGLEGRFAPEADGEAGPPGPGTARAELVILERE